MPPSSFTELGALPAGLSFVNNGNGTATHSGVPQSGTAGEYTLTIQASNGIGQAQIQLFNSAIEA